MGTGHWAETTLRQIVLSKKGKKPKLLTEKQFKDSIPYILIDQLEGKRFKFYSNERNLPIANPDDVLLVWDGSIGKCASGISGIIGSTIIGLTPLGSIPTKFIEYVIRYANKTIKETSTGTGLQHINRNFIDSYIIHLPPLPEQKRIAAKLDAILSKIKAAKTRLEKVPAMLKKFRQSMLAAACSGRLTADWREGKNEITTGKDLLTIIQKYRIQEYEKKCADCISQEIRKPKKPILLKENTLSHTDYDLPLTWSACHIGDIGEVSNGATPSRPQKEYWNGDIPWINSGCVCNNRISQVSEYITNAGLENSSVKLLPKGTVLIAMIGEGKTRGQSSILDIDATINQNIAGIEISHGKVVSEYLQFWFFLNYEKNREIGSGTGPRALNCNRVRELGFVLPPLPEQQEIVRRVEKLFALTDSIKEKYQNAAQYIEKLEQALLAKAFRGELAEADANDESAEALLERIRAGKGK